MRTRPGIFFSLLTMRVSPGLFGLVLLSVPALAQQPGTVLFTETIARGNQGDQFGRSVALLGDLNDDGVSDLVVGATHSDDGDTDAGSVWILFMKADRSVLSTAKISNTSGGLTYTIGEDDQFGKSVEGLGDLDGDGVEDLAVGAARGEDVYVLLLNTDGTVKADHKISHNTGDFGYGIATVGDYDGNGVGDIVVGDGFGDAFLYFLEADGTHSGYVEITGDAYGGTGGFDDFFGVGVSSLGDWDGDGMQDVAIGDTAFDGGFDDSGAVHLLTFDANGDVQDETLIYDGVPGFSVGMPDYPNFGRDVAVIDDLDGNGVPELAIGCSECYGPGEPEDSGAVFIVFLDTAGNVIDWQQISRLAGFLNEPLTDFDEFGITVTNIGDWNEDGVSDLAVGARFDDNGTGKLYLLMINDGFGIPVDASFRALPSTGTAPLTVQFTDTSDGQVATWDWDFGDGVTSTEQSPSHVYAANGTYDVTLTVGHANGRTDTVVVEGAVVVQDGSSDFIRLGCGTNPVDSFSVQSGEPVIGTSIVFGIDNPYGTQPAGSSTAVAYAFSPDANYPCGRLVPGFGQSGPGALGEILISLVAPNPVRISNGSSYGGPGQPGLSTLTIPNNVSLIGTTVYVQGFVVDNTGTSGIARGLTDALEFTFR